MDAVQLEAQVRTETGTSSANRLRRAGYLPGIIYGKETGDIPFTTSAKEAERIIADTGQSGLIKVHLAGDEGDREFTTLVREVQRHPVKGDITHLDLFQISLKDKLQTEVTVVLTGEAPGLKHGGILQHGLREILVECLPADLPDSLAADISGMQIGSKLTVGELQPPSGVEIITGPDSVVVSIVAPRMEEEPEAVEGETAEAAPEAETADEE